MVNSGYLKSPAFSAAGFRGFLRLERLLIWKMPVKTALVILFLLVTLPVLAADEAAEAVDFQIKYTRDLYEACSMGPDNAFYDKGKAFCYGYILSAFHYDLALHQGKDSKRLVCPEPDTTLLDVVAAFRHWVEQNPRYLEELPVEGVMRSAMAQWPCR